MDNERRETHFTGRVQGVGFRYTVRQIAAGLKVAGFVRNLPDGSVQLVAEGPAEEIDRLLAELKANMGTRIRSTQEMRRPATGEFRDFRVR